MRYRTPAPSNAAQRAGGFSLVEMLIAIGILAVALSMASAMFPMGMRDVMRSYQNSLGTLICQNGAGLARLHLSAADAYWAEATLKDAGVGARIPASDLKYAGQDGLGYVALCRRATADENDFQLLVVSYRLADPSGSISVSTVPGVNSGTVSEITIPGGHEAKFQIGGAAINPATGEYARITAVSGSTAMLEHELSLGGSVLLVHEADAGRSPVLAVLATRTALKP